ncbi:MAG: hypothetical protein PHO80_04520, partial [Candidatus Gracilibacteria bacterium]|nr:hypothetical protein [Candidatus Gracilibacteria bacterium]
HTEVPLQIDLKDYTFATRDILNSQTIEYFEQLEFKSLIPANSSKSNNESIKIKHKEIKDIRELAQIEALIYEVGEVIISLEEDLKKENIFGVTLGISDSFYFVDAMKFDLRNFFKQIFDSEVLVVGYDLKEDMKKIWKYIDEISDFGMEKRGDTGTQASLF